MTRLEVMVGAIDHHVTGAHVAHFSEGDLSGGGGHDAIEAGAGQAGNPSWNSPCQNISEREPGFADTFYPQSPAIFDPVSFAGIKRPEMRKCLFYKTLYWLGN